MDLIRFVAAFARRHWRAYAAAALMLVGIAVLTVMIPRQIGHIIDGLVAGDLVGSVAAGASSRCCSDGRGGLLPARGLAPASCYAAAYRLGVELRKRLYARLALQGPAFFQRQRTGDLMALATNDIDAVEMAAGEAMLAGFDGTLTLVLVVGDDVAGRRLRGWRLVALLPFPLMALALLVDLAPRARRVAAVARTLLRDLNDHVQETLAGVRTVRALGLQARSAGAVLQRWPAGAADASFDAQQLGSGLRAGRRLHPDRGHRADAGRWAAGWSGRSELTVGQLTSFSLYLGQLIWPMFAAGWVLSLLERGKAAWGRLQPVLDAPLTVDDHGTVRAGRAAARWSAHGVRFQLSGPAAARAAMASRSNCSRAARWAWSGPTGAGKSTLLRLLLRHDAPPAGQHALERRRSAATTRWTRCAPPSPGCRRKPFLFSASVAENIALARPDATRDEIEHAAKLAAVHDDILRLPHGYDTPVGERGVTLSGGQRQRVAIARALLTDAPLLLLDDALSAVDTDTEARILAHLRQARVGRTAIIVSHRLSAVADADEIVVLRDGHVAEQGDHAALLARNGWYARQWRYQQLEASLDARAESAIAHPGLPPKPAGTRTRSCARCARACLLLRAAATGAPSAVHRRRCWLMRGRRCWRRSGPLFGKCLIDHYLLPRNARLAAIAGLLLGALRGRHGGELAALPAARAAGRRWRCARCGACARACTATCCACR